MASKSILVCDIHQDEDETVKTRTIAVDGSAIQVELCEKAFKDEPLSRILEAGRTAVRAAARARRPAPTRPPQADTTTKTVAPGVPATSFKAPAPPAVSGTGLDYSPAVRAWAKGEGMRVGNNGRIRREVIDAYVSAHS
jgi:hypothetical protein